MTRGVEGNQTRGGFAATKYAEQTEMRSSWTRVGRLRLEARALLTPIHPDRRTCSSVTLLAPTEVTQKQVLRSLRSHQDDNCERRSGQRIHSKWYTPSSWPKE